MALAAHEWTLITVSITHERAVQSGGTKTTVTCGEAGGCGHEISTDDRTECDRKLWDVNFFSFTYLSI